MTNQQPTVVGGRYEPRRAAGPRWHGRGPPRAPTPAWVAWSPSSGCTDLASDATFQARFRREAQSAASLNHPAIVAVYDTGEEPGHRRLGVPQPYIVMEFVAGHPARHPSRGPQDPRAGLEITSGVPSALDYSHRAGIIHRDIKPRQRNAHPQR